MHVYMGGHASARVHLHRAALCAARCLVAGGRQELVSAARGSAPWMQSAKRRLAEETAAHTAVTPRAPRRRGAAERRGRARAQRAPRGGRPARPCSGCRRRCARWTATCARASARARASRSGAARTWRRCRARLRSWAPGPSSWAAGGSRPSLSCVCLPVLTVMLWVDKWLEAGCAGFAGVAFAADMHAGGAERVT